MQRRHTVDRMATHDREVRHAYTTIALLVDQRKTRDHPRIVREALGGIVQQFPVDAVDDLHVPRQHMLHERHRPSLERLGHQGVVGVGEDLSGDVPSVGPDETVPVAQEAHEFSDPDRGVGVVEVDRDMHREVRELAVLGKMAGQDVLQGCRDEEILLPQPQLATSRGAVVRVEHPGDVLVLVLDARGAGVVPAVEGRKVDLLRRGGTPQPERAHMVRAVPRHHEVVCPRQHFARRPPMRLASVVLDPSAEPDLPAHRRAGELPWDAVGEPRIRVFELSPVPDDLREHAVFVADAIAHGRQVQRGHGIEETGGQTAETAVAQPGVRLFLDDVLETLRAAAQLGDDRFGELQSIEGVGQAPPDQELHREVIDPTGLVGSLPGLGGDPASGQALACRQSGRHQQIVTGRLGRRDTDLIAQARVEIGRRFVHGGSSRMGGVGHRKIGQS